MEDTSRLTPEEMEKNFKTRLVMSPIEVQDRYYAVYLDENLRRAEKHGGKPDPNDKLSLEEKEKFFKIAKTTKSKDEARLVIKMERDYDNAHSKDGRPPIGGAQDD